MNPFLQIVSPETTTDPKGCLNNVAASDKISETGQPENFSSVFGTIAISGEGSPGIIPVDLKARHMVPGHFQLNLTGSDIYHQPGAINQNFDGQNIQPIKTDINLISGIVSDREGDPSTRLMGAMPEPESTKATAESILFKSDIQPKYISVSSPAETLSTQILENVNVKEIEIVKSVDKPNLLLNNKNSTGITARTMTPISEPVVQSMMSNTGQEMGEPGNQSLFDKNLFKTQFELTGTNKTSLGEISATNFSDIIKTERVVGKNEIQQIKFIMPQDLNHESVKEHKTITIKMEPQSLGTIRLTLSSHVNNLTGRMIVDSPTTLMALESNLHNLYHELSEKGIKLDSLQLSLGGSQTGGFTESGLKSEFDQFFGSGRASNGQPFNSENSSDIPDNGTGQPATGTYITAGGVNWLA